MIQKETQAVLDRFRTQDLMQMLPTVDTVAGLNVRLHWNFFKGD